MGLLSIKTVKEGIQEMRRQIEQGVIGDYDDPKYSNYKTLIRDSTAVGLRRDVPSSRIY
jgi:hypothetical protein